MKKSYHQLAIWVVASGVLVSPAVHADARSNMVLEPIALPTDLTEVVRQSGDAVVQREILDNSSSLPAPVLELSLSRRINVADLDLETEYGSMALEKRVKDAAKAMCQTLGQKLPLSTPNDERCAKVATHEAMVKARELITKAHQKPANALSSTMLRPEAGSEPTSTVIAVGH